MMQFPAATIAFLGAFLAATVLPAATAMELRGRGQTSPELDPESHEEFFGKDNPKDDRAVADKHYRFNYPFPSVQHSGKFDTDYVKDENSDGGEWEAQMNYDTLRSQIVKKQKEVDEAAKKEEEEQKEFDVATVNEQEAEKVANEKEELAAEAKKEHQQAQEKLEDFIGKPGERNGTIAEATTVVENEMEDLENCTKELAKAREQLKKLTAEKEAREKAEGEAEAKAAEATLTSPAPQASSSSASNATTNSSGESENAVEAAEKKLAEENAEYATAKKAYDEATADVEAEEAELKKAEQSLEDLRHPPAAMPGANDKKTGLKSGAAGPSSASGALLGLLSALAVFIAF